MAVHRAVGRGCGCLAAAHPDRDGGGGSIGGRPRAPAPARTRRDLDRRAQDPGRFAVGRTPALRAAAATGRHDRGHHPGEPRRDPATRDRDHRRRRGARPYRARGRERVTRRRAWGGRGSLAPFEGGSTADSAGSVILAVVAVAVAVPVPLAVATGVTVGLSALALAVIVTVGRRRRGTVLLWHASSAALPLRLVLGLVLEVRERVLQAVIVRVDDEERLVTADRVVEAGQALAWSEVGPARVRRALLGGADLGCGRPLGPALSRGTAHPHGPRGDDKDGLMRASWSSQGRMGRRERTDRDHHDDRDDRVPPGLPRIRRAPSLHAVGIGRRARGTRAAVRGPQVGLRTELEARVHHPLLAP